MEPVTSNETNVTNEVTVTNEITVTNEPAEAEKIQDKNPLFAFMGIGSLIYAFFYTFFLYKNSSGITYPFFVGGTCLFFFFYLKKSGITAKKSALFPLVSLLLLGISTCMTDSYVLIFLNKVGIFFLFFYLVIHSLYEDKLWDITKYMVGILNIICTSFVFMFRPFTDFSLFIRNKKEAENKPQGKGKYIFYGLLLAIPFLIVILSLLYEADAVFSDILDKLLYLDFDFRFDIIFDILFLFLFAFVASYSIMCRLSRHDLKEENTDKKKLEPVMGITFTALLSMVYLVFCYIQVFYLFGGLGTLPQDYTYASYAREGFFQLVAVCFINLFLVLGCSKYFREDKILKGILTFISVCTYIMMLSSTYRMILYIQVYYLTFLRVFVLWALAVIFLLMSGALIMIYRKNFPYTRYCITTLTILYLIFSFAHPDYWIARYNLSRNEEIDYYYLTRLSLDAAPAIFDHYDKSGLNSDYWFTEYASRMVKKSYDYQAEELDEIWVEEGECLPKKQSPRTLNFSRLSAYRRYQKCYQLNPDFAMDVEYNIMCYANDYYGRP